MDVLVPNPFSSANNKRRAQQLLSIFAAVLLLTSLVIGLTINSGKTLKEHAVQLTEYRIPELREVNELHSAMDGRVKALYLYYATFNSMEWKTQDQQLQTQANLTLSTLGQLGLGTNERQTFTNLVTEFTKITILFDNEMNEGENRDWDKLREHLANSQLKINQISALLNGWSEKINDTAQDGGATALKQVNQLTQLQLGFSLAVMVISGFVLFALYGRLKDQDELYRRAYYDDTTNLPNRQRLERDLAKILSLHSSGALLVIHVNRLNVIASTYGHSIADELLIQIAQWINEQGAVDSHPVNLYHVTSDSFAMLQPFHAQLDPHILAQKIVGISSHNFNIGERHLRGDVKIGIAKFTAKNETAANLLRNAFAALNANGDGNNIHLFEPRMTEESERWLSTESALRTALQSHEFELHYQPKVDSKTLTTTSSEALIRWRHKDKLVSPAQFIPVAEDSGLIIPIGNWVLLEAWRQWREWNNLHQPALPIAVNISAQQFQDSAFLTQVKTSLEQYQVPPAMIELEITEAVAAGDPESAVTTMEALKAIGVSLAIDDFGTGYSSLSYLKRFPIDTLKIDIAFVRNIHSACDDEAIASMILALGKQLNLKVVAEGVELEAQQKLLTSMGCDILQGYLFSKPLNAQEFSARLMSQQ